ncbi:hypothetical protein F442_22574 [Phytophthora nicotianae P10297]|uniref:Uncharacterized protein n=1 Tax=Phytophthora nicotianae P10297 TaxID=1317064 RepID=W2Y0G7_PHYNI|nr:hypothetical protein F442_22574 [Phytophthora nicotianae P10297]
MNIPNKAISGSYSISDVEEWIRDGEYESLYEFHRSIGIPKKHPYGDLFKAIDPVSVFGFNFGIYDINLIKNDLFTVLGVNNIKSVIKNPSYMCISTSNFNLPDILNYAPAGMSYEKYLSTYIRGCKCEYKIRCICGLSKGVFPYEYIKIFEVINETSIHRSLRLIVPSVEQRSVTQTMSAGNSFENITG